MPEPTLLRYLSASDVTAAMPPIEERLRLAEITMRALIEDAELPPKIGVHPRPGGSFAHAMPALLRGSPEDGRDDRLGMKWIAGFATNNALGLPAIHGLVLLNDSQTGVPVAILDAAPLTAARTAAVSGIAIRQFAPPIGDRAPRAALIGAGVQARSHLPLLGHLLGGLELTVFDRHADRAESVAEIARRTAGIAGAGIAPSARAATEGADVVVTAASFGPVRQVMTNDWLEPEALIVPVDYATYCAAEVARDADLFIVDERAQFLANREAGAFDEYPEPAMTFGEALRDAVPRPPGRVVATHLGVGLADVVFGDAVMRAAAARGLGTVLPG